MISRFAPSTTGEAHPGTLLSALLVWLDARARDGTAILRLEDLDRTRDIGGTVLIEALDWLGLQFDQTIVQSDRGGAHDAALDQLAAQGRLYPCTCSRAARTRLAPDGGRAYDNTCRDTPLPFGGWRELKTTALRARLPDDRIELVDDGGMDLSQTPALEMGDPIVRRRDGAIAYQLAVVVDDADEHITDVIRGRDIAPSTATQVMLQRVLGMPTPRYRHHFLLLERAHGDKLAKLHGSLPWRELSARYTGAELRDRLAQIAGLADSKPASFDWARVRTDDVSIEGLL
ncbi:MAG TPA: glutamate--tRNA ligase family protein [Kofleriaceae bacterium]